MRNLKNIIAPAIMLVALTILMAHGQWRGGPNRLINHKTITNVTVYPYGTNVVFPVGGTSVVFQTYWKDANIDPEPLTIYSQKSGDATNWVTLLTWQVARSTVAGGSVYSFTSCPVGEYGFVRINIVSNPSPSDATNFIIIATHK